MIVGNLTPTQMRFHALDVLKACKVEIERIPRTSPAPHKGPMAFVTFINGGHKHQVIKLNLTDEEYTLMDDQGLTGEATHIAVWRICDLAVFYELLDNSDE